MKIYLSIIFTLLLGSFAFGQQELTLHFMDVQQRTQTNPAFFNNRKVSFALPSVYVDLAHTGFSFQDIVSTDPSTGDKTLDVDNALATMKAYNHLRTQLQADAFNLAIQIKSFQIGLSASVKTDAYFNYPKSLIDLGWNGNAKFIGETVVVDPDISATAYAEYGLSLARSWQDGKIQVGGKVKYLSGFVNASKTSGQFSIYTHPEIYQLEVDTDFIMRTSNIDPEEGVTMDNPSPFSQNRGFATDLGIVIRPVEQVMLSLSVIDFGSITWRENPTSYVGSGSFAFNGLDVGAYALKDSIDFEEEMEILIDSAQNAFEVVENTNPYSTRLPTKIYLSGTFSPIKSLRLGGLFYNEFYRGRHFPSLTLSATKDVGKFLTAGLTYSYRNKRADNVGAHLTLKGGPIWLFMATDNALAFINPKSARSTNFRFGLNLVFGKS